MFRLHVAALGAAALLCVAPGAARAQPLSSKRALALPAAGCLRAPAPPAAAARRDAAESRRLAAQGREAALVGDHAAARDALRRATALDPTDPQLVYALGRADEELADTAAAVADYCRHLALSPGGAQAEDVRQRLLRLAPTAASATRRALDAFRAGVAALDAGRHAEAAAAFDRVLRDAPNAPEALFDRALARAALGRRGEAARDLEAYLTAPQSADDRALVLRTLDALRRPTYAAGTALTRGLIAPGLGQFYTGRSALGVVALGAAAGAAGAALYERTVVRERTFTDPFGNPYTQAIAESERPYVVPAIAAGAAVWILAAFEARHYASSRSGGGIRIAPFASPRGAAGLRVRATF